MPSLMFGSLVLAAASGAVVGSFIVTASIRAVNGDSVFIGRSRCDSCQVPLSYLQTVPVVSYVVSGARCKACGGSISYLHPLTEVAAVGAAISVVAFLPVAHWLWAALLAALLLFVGTYDALTMRVPNLANLSIAGLGLLLASFEQRLVEVMLVGGGAVVLLLLVHYAFMKVRGRSGIGMGDVKLMAALSIWTGAEHTPIAVLVACVIALSWTFLSGQVQAGRRLPFAPAIAVGFWVVYVAGAVT